MAELWPILQVLLTAIVGAVGFLMRRSVTQIDARMDRHDERLDRNEGRLLDLEETRVTKEDWLRESSLARQRLDNISTGIARLDAKHDQSVEIAAAIAAALHQQRNS